MSAHSLDPSNIVLLAGVVPAAARRRTLPSGEEMVDFDVTTRGPTGTCTAPVAWFSPGPSVAVIAPGAEVLVAGAVRRRFFRVAGATQSRTEVVATCVVDASDRRAVARLRAVVVDLVATTPARQPTRRAPGVRSVAT